MKEHEPFTHPPPAYFHFLPVTYRTAVSWLVFRVVRQCAISARAWASSALCFVVSRHLSRADTCKAFSRRVSVPGVPDPTPHPPPDRSVLFVLLFLALEQQRSYPPLPSFLPSKNS